MTQKSREALIELLFLALYLDQHLSVDEDEVLNKALASLGWESDVACEVFIFKAFSRGREAATCESKTIDFLEGRLSVIKEDGLQSEAMTWLYKILSSDGLSKSEKQFLKRIEAHLFP